MRDLVAFTQQIATLLEAGLPLDRALGIMEELAPSLRLRLITGDVLRSVQSGTSLAEALAKHHPRPFSRLYINMVRAGEKGASWSRPSAAWASSWRNHRRSATPWCPR